MQPPTLTQLGLDGITALSTGILVVVLAFPVVREGADAYKRLQADENKMIAQGARDPTDRAYPTKHDPNVFVEGVVTPFFCGAFLGFCISRMFLSSFIYTRERYEFEYGEDAGE